MALSDKLHGLEIDLRNSFFKVDHPYYKYPDDIVEEVEDILQRMDRLRDKIDHPYYVGSNRFNDAGDWDAYLHAMMQVKIELKALAGDLTADFIGKDEIEQNAFDQDELYNYRLALAKLRSEGKDDLIQEIRRKHLQR